MNTGLSPRLEAVAAAAFGVALSAWLFYPGLMSFDSAVQFSQARGALPLDDVHPPLMSLLWRASDRVIAGPGGLFLGFCLAWWSGLAALLWQVDTTRAKRWAGFLLVGLWPATLLMLAHLWKDVGMTAALLLASAATLAWRRGGTPLLRHAAFAALLMACMLRHNGLFAAAPILAWLLWPRGDEAGRWRARGGATALLLLALVMAPGLLVRAVGASHGQPWTVVAQWDLAAISIDTGEMLLPASSTLPGTTPADLAPGYVPWANPPLFDLRKLRLSFYLPFDAAQQRDLLQAWGRAVWRHPGAYLAHRARLARYYLFGFPAELPRELVYAPLRMVREDVTLNVPPVAPEAWQWRLAERLRTTPLFAGGSYLVLALVALLWHRRRRGPAREAVVVLAASSWANALPLFVISGSAEFRYLTWTALAALLACVFAAFGPARESVSIAR